MINLLQIPYLEVHSHGIIDGSNLDGTDRVGVMVAYKSEVGG